MAVFKKRNTLLQNMTYMALMACINVVCVLMSNFVVGLLFVLVFILPLTSAIVTVFCKKIYFPIYLVVTVAICCLINLPDTVFYVIPSIITGFIFGLLIEKEFPPHLMIFLNSVLQTVLSYAFIMLYQLITGRNIFADVVTIFGLQDFQYASYIKYVVVFGISLIQETITYVVLKTELNKFDVGTIENKKVAYAMQYIPTFAFILLSVLFAFVYPDFSYLCAAFSLFFGAYQLVELIVLKKRAVYFFLLGAIIVGLFVFACAYKAIPKPFGLLLIQVYPLLITIIVFINNHLLKENKQI